MYQDGWHTEMEHCKLSPCGVTVMNLVIKKTTRLESFTCMDCRHTIRFVFLSEARRLSMKCVTSCSKNPIIMTYLWLRAQHVCAVKKENLQSFSTCSLFSHLPPSDGSTLSIAWLYTWIPVCMSLQYSWKSMRKHVCYVSSVMRYALLLTTAAALVSLWMNWNRF